MPASALPPIAFARSRCETRFRHLGGWLVQPPRQVWRNDSEAAAEKRDIRMIKNKALASLAERRQALRQASQGLSGQEMVQVPVEGV